MRVVSSPARGLFVLAGVLAPLAVACSSADESASSFPTPKDDAFLPASDETKRELGIEKWGVTNDGPRSTAIVHGYGARDEMLVELRHVTKVIDDSHVEIDITLSGKRGSGRMRLGMEGREGPTPEESEVEIKMLDNDIAEDPAAAKLLSRMNVDTNSEVPVTTASTGVVGGSGGGKLVGSSIEPQDGNLVGNCSQLLASCGTQVVRAGGSAALNSDACARLVRAEGITLICGVAGRLVGRLVGGLIGSAVAPGAGTAVGGAVGGVAGGALAKEACRYATGARDARRDCASAATGAAGQAAQASQECQSIRSTCSGR
ncbi:MAG: hypothetical protein JST00_32455 [Deltaproteobacteria bacterium]|nr:hypothetical protein [Deltaproteobacteria bacterium]